MRELRLVTPGQDAGHIVVETEGPEGESPERFLLPITPELRAALDTATQDHAFAPARRPLPSPLSPNPLAQEAPSTASLMPDTQATAEPATAEPATAEPATETSTTEPTIGPREIQVRVRAGETPEQIAELFGAGLDWVMRFAGPVIDERGRITDEARRARARRTTSDAQTVIFGETVDARFSAHGIDPALVSWDSRRRDDGQWVISAHWVGGDSERTAEWTFSLSTRTVTAADETASDLLSDRPIRPVFTEAPVTLTTAPPLAPGVVAFPAMPNAHTGPLPREQLFDQQRFEENGRPVTPLAPPATTAPTRLTFDAPPLPLGMVESEREIDLVDQYLEEALDEPAEDVLEEAEPVLEEPTTRMPQVTNLGIAHRDPVRSSETEDEKAARAHIPSWDDILLGVRRKND